MEILSAQGVQRRGGDVEGTWRDAEESGAGIPPRRVAISTGSLVEPHAAVAAFWDAVM